MTKEETIEVLLILKDKLENTNHFFMCRILESRSIPCTFLKESGLEDIWVSNPECVLSIAWVFNGDTLKDAKPNQYKKSLREKKIECINILLKQLGHG